MKYQRSTVNKTTLYPILWAIGILFLFMLGTFLWYAVNTKQELISPLGDNEVIIIDRLVIKETSKPPKTIEDEIRMVFGEHADKAFRLLECENKGLNPNAISKTGDYGVFQINEYWQETQRKFLLNRHINIQIAWHLYEENGHTFKMWTCGKKLGI